MGLALVCHAAVAAVRSLERKCGLGKGGCVSFAVCGKETACHQVRLCRS